MKLCIFLPSCVRALLADGHSCYIQRRNGECKCKSVKSLSSARISLSLCVISSSMARMRSRVDGHRPPPASWTKACHESEEVLRFLERRMTGSMWSGWRFRAGRTTRRGCTLRRARERCCFSSARLISIHP
ncbi:hypothetical protein BDQ12DRAFT_682186 [Crucibulum laeve]|uniref:Secreted protein n=1 Tax=Crucibulum laeve TaxID=68775 RepID=A0A5C3M2Y2_9AGAR|nr:hypothetical protein BDQ12DRAFT_682186 [Crucibulum laeve]